MTGNDNVCHALNQKNTLEAFYCIQVDARSHDRRYLRDLLRSPLRWAKVRLETAESCNDRPASSRIDRNGPGTRCVARSRNKLDARGDFATPPHHLEIQTRQEILLVRRSQDRVRGEQNMYCLTTGPVSCSSSTGENFYFRAFTSLSHLKKTSNMLSGQTVNCRSRTFTGKKRGLMGCERRTHTFP